MGISEEGGKTWLSMTVLVTNGLDAQSQSCSCPCKYLMLMNQDLMCHLVGYNIQYSK